MVSDNLQTISADLKIITARAADLEQEHKRLLNLVDSMGEQLEKTDKLLDMLRPDIEMKERCILNDERLIELIAAYRQIRPK